MDSPLTTRYFLGANSRCGFHSLYGGFCRPEKGCFLNVIKGGPGCGKSSFMGRIGRAAEERGLAVEYILCSGDPDSIDGVFIPQLGVGYVDGTSPHSIDSPYPGGSGMYLDLGRFYDSQELRRGAERIIELNRRYKALYSAAYAYIAAGASMLPRCYPGLWGEKEEQKLMKKISGFAQREFKLSSGKCADVHERFLSAFSCKGMVFLSETLTTQCSRVCVLDNELGMGHLYLEKLLPLVIEKGYDVIVCRDCLDPKLISALLIPSLSLGLVCGDCGCDYEGEIYRHMRLDAMADREHLAAIRPALRKAKRLSRDSLALATDTLAEAKALHDELESLYNPHVDFEGVYAEAEKHIAMLF